MSSNEQIRQQVIKALRTVRDPEIPLSIYDLGLIYGIDCAGDGTVAIRMTLTAPNCPVAESLPAQVKSAVKSVPGVKDASVELVFDPPWDKSKMPEAARLALGIEGLIPIKGALR